MKNKFMFASIAILFGTDVMAKSVEVYSINKILPQLKESHRIEKEIEESLLELSKKYRETKQKWVASQKKMQLSLHKLSREKREKLKKKTLALHNQQLELKQRLIGQNKRLHSEKYRPLIAKIKKMAKKVCEYEECSLLLEQSDSAIYYVSKDSDISNLILSYMKE